MPEINPVNDTRILVADIGGTHARFGIATISDDTAKPAIDNFQVYECADHQDMQALIQHYLDVLPVEKPAIATLAVAGPIADNKGQMTNIGWHVDGAQLAENLGFDALYFINDFGALAMAIPSLDNKDLISIRKTAKAAKGPISIIGPGTGFGTAICSPKRDGIEYWLDDKRGCDAS